MHSELGHADPGLAHRWVWQLVAKVGVPEEDARLLADGLIQAHLSGMDGHGLFFLPTYVTRLEAGLIARTGEVRVLREGPAFALLDGGNLLGHVSAWKAMGVAIAKAAEAGVGMVTLCRGNHSGIMARYTLRAAEAGCIGIASTNTPPLMAPWGGYVPFFGTNPISIAVPAGPEPPVVLDMATSAVARSKLLVADKAGARIPPSWGLDERGMPTEDPQAALRGTMAPMAGHKGFGLALMMDALSGVLAGAASGPEVGDVFRTDAGPQNVGHFFQAIHLERLGQADAVRRRMAEMVRALHAAPTAPGTDRIRVPGDVERETATARRRGFPLSRETADGLRALGDRYGIPWPC
ncbi:MAG: Ldh family oxidoreductase [Candidatus Methylomirabilota bacterium]